MMPITLMMSLKVALRGRAEACHGHSTHATVLPLLLAALLHRCGGPGVHGPRES
ncbi:MAG: hypothetical protein HOY79_13790 [Streptomyces sp.]|nr:hypothetical protein [Streptomyces sp.]